MSDYINRTNNEAFKAKLREYVSNECVALCNLHGVDSAKYHVALTLDAVGNKSSFQLITSGYKGRTVVLQKDTSIFPEQYQSYATFDPSLSLDFRLTQGDIVNGYTYCVSSWLDRRIPKLWNFDFDCWFGRNVPPSIENLISNAHQSIASDGTLVVFTFIVIPNSRRLNMLEGSPFPRDKESLRTFRENQRLPMEQLVKRYINQIKSRFDTAPCIKVEYEPLDDDPFSGLPGVSCSEFFPAVIHKNPLETANGSTMMTVVLKLRHDHSHLHPLNTEISPIQPEYPERKLRLDLIEFILENKHGIFRDCNIRNFQRRFYEKENVRVCTMCGEIQSGKTECQCIEVIVNKIVHPKRPILFVCMDKTAALKQTYSRLVKYLDRLRNALGFRKEWLKFLDFTIVHESLNLKKMELDLTAKLQGGTVFMILQNETRLNSFLTLCTKVDTSVHAIIDEADILFPCFPMDLTAHGSARANVFYRGIIRAPDRFTFISLYTATPQTVFLADSDSEMKLSDCVIVMEFPPNYIPFHSFPINWSCDSGTGSLELVESGLNYFFDTCNDVKSCALQPQLLINLNSKGHNAGFKRLRTFIYEYVRNRAVVPFYLIQYTGEAVKRYVDATDNSQESWDTLDSLYREEDKKAWDERHPIIIIAADLAARAISYCSENHKIRITTMCYEISDNRADVNIMQEQRYLGCYNFAYHVTIVCTQETKERIVNAFNTCDQRIKDVEKKKADETSRDVMIRAKYNTDKPLVNPIMMRRIRFQQEAYDLEPVAQSSRTGLIKREWGLPIQSDAPIDSLLQKEARENLVPRYELMTEYHVFEKPDFANDIVCENDRLSSADQQLMKKYMQAQFPGRTVRFAFEPNTRGNFENNPVNRRTWTATYYNRANTVNVDFIDFVKKHLDPTTGSDFVHVVSFNIKYDATFRFDPQTLYAYHTFDGNLKLFLVNDDEIESEDEAIGDVMDIDPPSYNMFVDEDIELKPPRPKSTKLNEDLILGVKKYVQRYIPIGYRFTSENLIDHAKEREEFHMTHRDFLESQDYVSKGESSMIVYPFASDPSKTLKKYLKSLADDMYLRKIGPSLYQRSSTF